MSKTTYTIQFSLTHDPRRIIGQVHTKQPNRKLKRMKEQQIGPFDYADTSDITYVIYKNVSDVTLLDEFGE